MTENQKLVLPPLDHMTLNVWDAEKAAKFYAVEDRIPRVYPWMNEPGGGIMPPWNTSEQRTVSTIFNTTWFGFVNTAAGS